MITRVSYAITSIKNRIRLPIFNNGSKQIGYSSIRYLQTSTYFMDRVKIPESCEIMKYDVIIVGGGPSGLSTAIQLKKKSEQENIPLSVCVLEKSERIGSHILSGNLFNSIALDELIPNWKEKNAPINTKVHHENVYYCTSQHSIKIPHLLLPQQFNNKDNYIISLSSLTRWLGKEAEEKNVDIFTGVSMDSLVVDKEHKQIVGAYLNDDNGLFIEGKYICIGEGVNGTFSNEIIKYYSLRENKRKDIYALGIKEIWERNPSNKTSNSSLVEKEGTVTNYIGYPSFRNIKDTVYGAGFIYAMSDTKLAVGYMFGLDYTDPSINIYNEFQEFKSMPSIHSILSHYKPIEYGAKCIYEGGVYSMPNPVFPGGLLIGESARLVDTFKIKGAHLAIKSGILAANSIINELKKNYESPSPVLSQYKQDILDSYIYKEIYRGRISRYTYRINNYLAALYTGTVDRLYGLFYNLLYQRRKTPEQLPNRYAISDDEMTKSMSSIPTKRYYPFYNHTTTYDRQTALQLSSLNYDETLPSHITIQNPSKVNDLYKQYNGIEFNFCPAQVYEYRENDKQIDLTINHTNCLHCKTCTIKAPHHNINWKPPKHGNGPNYIDM